jgi:uncharacterized membrane protein
MMPVTKRQLLLSLLFVLPLMGFADTVYLSYKGIFGGPVVCNVIDGCSVVLESGWSSVFGIQTAVYGVVYYGVLSLFAAAYVYWKDAIMLYLVAVISGLGLLFSSWLVYVQIFQLAAVCEYCMLSAALTLLTTVVAWLSVGRVGCYNTSSKIYQDESD